MVNTIKRVVSASVFRKMPPDYSMSDIFAALFHRLAATLYLIYSVWAVDVILRGVSSLVAQQGDQWTSIFAAFVLLTTGPACLGASFFPKLANLELYSGGAFIALMAVYYFFLVRNTIETGGSEAGVILLMSIIVMPLARTLIIMYFLVKQAEARRSAEAILDQDGTI
jgi:hypothetical protein